MSSSADSKNKIVHPYENESLFDILGRFMNEMDFVGQERARKFCLVTQVLSAVSQRCHTHQSTLTLDTLLSFTHR